MGTTREEAIKHLENMKWLKGYSNTTVDGKPLENIIDDIIVLLKAQEPRVRCKDCKYAQHDVMYHDIWCDGIIRQPEWYCADGKRRCNSEAD